MRHGSDLEFSDLLKCPLSTGGPLGLLGSCDEAKSGPLAVAAAAATSDGVRFLRLADLDCEALVVADRATVATAAAALQGASRVGLDCEWRPFRSGALPTPVALLQVATARHAFLFDLLALETPPQGMKDVEDKDEMGIRGGEGRKDGNAICWTNPADAAQNQEGHAPKHGYLEWRDLTTRATAASKGDVGYTRRYFAMSGRGECAPMLHWYESEREWERHSRSAQKKHRMRVDAVMSSSVSPPEGSLHLTGACPLPPPGPDTLSWIVACASGVHWELRAPSTADAQGWLCALARSQRNSLSGTAGAVGMDRDLQSSTSGSQDSARGYNSAGQNMPNGNIPGRLEEKELVLVKEKSYEKKPESALEAYRRLVLGLLANDQVVKLGFGFQSDAARLAASYPGTYGSGVSTSGGGDGSGGGGRGNDIFAGILDLQHQRLKSCETDKRKGSGAGGSGGGRGLAAAVHRAMGGTAHLDKAMQVSDWGARPLSPAQVEYAALDARCLLEISDHA